MIRILVAIEQIGAAHRRQPVQDVLVTALAHVHDTRQHGEIVAQFGPASWG